MSLLSNCPAGATFSERSLVKSLDLMQYITKRLPIKTIVGSKKPRNRKKQVEMFRCGATLLAFACQEKFCRTTQNQGRIFRFDAAGTQLAMMSPSYLFSSSIRFSACFRMSFLDYENEDEYDDEYDDEYE